MNSIIVCDFIEITIVTTFFYYCFMWLDKNKEKELLKPVLLMIILSAIASVFELMSLQILFFYITTPASIIYYLVHEKQLKKNHTALHHSQSSLNFKNPCEIQKNTEIILQEAMYGLCNGKNIAYMLEQSDSLELLITPSLYFNTPVSKEIIKFLIQSTKEDQVCSILIKNSHIIGSIIPLFDDLIIGSDQREIQQILEPILINTDAIIVLGFHISNQWAILHKEYGYFNITAKELFTILHHFLYKGDQDHYDFTKNNKANSSQYSL
jgi:hypothetical protein